MSQSKTHPYTHLPSRTHQKEGCLPYQANKQAKITYSSTYSDSIAMADVAALSPKVPQAWQRALLPFIQRAAEFEQVKQPIVGYYLLKYVAEEGMDLYKKNPAMKSESTPFISALLDTLEVKKNLYKAQIEEIDGRTELSRAALALFTRADDDERRGVVSEAIVKLFYSSSLLFEATKQFMDDKKMDPFAAEKHKYAQVVAARMKKSLTSGTPYESPSGAKERVEGVPDEDGSHATEPAGGKGNLQGSSSSSQYGYNPPAQTTTPAPAGSSTSYGYVPPPPASAPPPPQNTGGYSYTPSAPVPAPSSSNHPPTSAYAPPPQQQQQHHQQQYPSAPQPQPSHPTIAPTAPQSHSTTSYPVNTYVPPAAPSGSYNPTPNDMIDAQKYAKLAVSSLQFYDHQNARKQLILALQYLDGQGPKQ